MSSCRRRSGPIRPNTSCRSTARLTSESAANPSKRTLSLPPPIGQLLGVADPIIHRSRRARYIPRCRSTLQKAVGAQKRAEGRRPARRCQASHFLVRSSTLSGISFGMRTSSTTFCLPSSSSTMVIGMFVWTCHLWRIGTRTKDGRLVLVRLHDGDDRLSISRSGLGHGLRPFLEPSVDRIGILRCRRLPYLAVYSLVSSLISGLVSPLTTAWSGT